MRPVEVLDDPRLRAVLRCAGGCLLAALHAWIRPRPRELRDVSQ
ncbi:hypothetical protein [Rhodococcus sp. NPDC003348]